MAPFFMGHHVAYGSGPEGSAVLLMCVASVPADAQRVGGGTCRIWAPSRVEPEYCLRVVATTCCLLSPIPLQTPPASRLWYGCGALSRTSGRTSHRTPRS